VVYLFILLSCCDDCKWQRRFCPRFSFHLVFFSPCAQIFSMGRQRNKNTHHWRKTSRKRRQICREISCDDQNSKLYSAIDNAPLPFGAYIDLDNFTTPCLFAGDENSREEWNKIRLQLIRFYSKEAVFDDTGKCIAYIRRKHITHLYIDVFNSNPVAIKNIRETIINAYYQNLFTYFYVYTSYVVFFRKAWYKTLFSHMIEDTFKRTIL
jgi:hypothetical protein